MLMGGVKNGSFCVAYNKVGGVIEQPDIVSRKVNIIVLNPIWKNT